MKSGLIIFNTLAVMLRTDFLNIIDNLCEKYIKIDFPILLMFKHIFMK